MKKNLILLGIVTIAALSAAAGLLYSKTQESALTPQEEILDEPTFVEVSDFEIPTGPTITEGPTQTNAPIYFFLFTHTEDHINHELSEERYTRGSDMIETLAEQESSLVWNLEFMGADAATIAERNPTTGIVDLLTGLAEEGLVDFGYHAQHEPTYMNRPQKDLSKNPSFDEVFEVITEWITCEKDPLRGGCVSPEGGGIQAVQDVFGPVHVVSGLGYQDGAMVERSAGVLAVEAQAPERWMGFGFPDHGAVVKQSGYEENRKLFFDLLSPTNETSSSLIWMDNFVRVNDGIPSDDLTSIKLSDGIQEVANTLASMTRSHPTTINVGFMDKYTYTDTSTSPTKWAYSHPDEPELPDDLTNSQQTIEKNYASTEASLTYLIETVIPENPGSRFVKSEDIFNLVTSEDYFEVEEEEQAQMALWLLNEWTDAPPNYGYDGEDFYSLTDAFFVFVHALQNEPSDETISHYFAAWTMDDALTNAVTVTPDEIIEAANAIDLNERIMDESFTVGSQTLSPAQFLYAMAYVVAMQHESVTVAEIEIPRMTGLPETYALLETIVSSPAPDTSWSLKPARFQD